MEFLVAKVLDNDSRTQKEVSKQIREIHKNPDSLQELCQLIKFSQQPKYRHCAAILLRNAIFTQENWSKVPLNYQCLIKKNILEALMNESVRIVRINIARAAAALLQHEKEVGGSWVQHVVESIMQSICSDDLNKCEIGAAVFVAITDSAGEAFALHMSMVCEMFKRMITTFESNRTTCSPILVNIIQGVSYLVPMCVGNALAEQTFQLVLPTIIRTIQTFAEADQDIDAFMRLFEMLENLVEYMPKLLTSELRNLLETCLIISANEHLPLPKRVKTIIYIGTLVMYKKNSIVQLKLVEPITEVIFRLMATPTNKVTADSFNDDSEDDAVSAAGITLDKLSSHIPSSKFFPAFLQLLQAALEDENVFAKRAAYMSLGIVSEGCSNLICKRYLEQMLAIIKNGIYHEHEVVRNAAIFSLEQFCEFLQPNIAQYAGDIIPIFVDYVQKATSETIDNNIHIFNTLELFCEYLEQEQIKPYLPILIERLFAIMNPTNSITLRESGLRVIASIVGTTSVDIMPYFNDLINIIRPYLISGGDSKLIELRRDSIYTLAMLVSGVGKKNFLPFAQDTMEFALQLIKSKDPDEKSAVYCLLRAMIETFNNDFKDIIPKIMPYIYESLTAGDDNASEMGVDEDINIEQSDAESDDDDEGYDVQDSYAEEKENSLLTLSCLAKYCARDFKPYTEESIKNVQNLLKNYVQIVRATAIETFVTISTMKWKQMDIYPEPDIEALVFELDIMLREEDEYSVVIKIINSLVYMLVELSGTLPFWLPDQKIVKLYLKILNDVLNNNLKCQQMTTIIEGDDEFNEDEIQLTEDAGDILPAIGRVSTAGEFVTYFDVFYNILINKIEKNKEKEDNSDFMIFFSLRLFADCFKSLLSLSAKYCDRLLPYLLTVVSHDCDRVRGNAIYCLGQLVYNSGSERFESFSDILNELSKVLATETKPPVLDNICGAVARLIATDHTLIELPQVLPVLFNILPLREDFSENSAVFECFNSLYVGERAIFLQYFDRIVSLGIHVFFNQQIEKFEDARITVSRIFKVLDENYQDELNAVLNREISAEQVEILISLIYSH